ncbi:MAG: succinate dehydrogenase/fumarate reductase flavoprotein subunit, partial [Chloroflexi bacterium]
DEVIAEFDRIRNGSGGARPHDIRKKMQDTMTRNVGVFRTDETMGEAVADLAKLRETFNRSVQIDDKGKQFNTDLLETWELGCLLELAEITAVSAIARTESRGGHARDDFPKRNDEEWLKHTLCHPTEDGKYELDYKPVFIGRYEPKERVY